MRRFQDKAVLMLFVSMLILYIFEGSNKVIMIFVMVTLASFMTYIRMLEVNAKRINLILTLFCGGCIIVIPAAAVLLPILFYEVFSDRQIIAGLVLLSGFIRFLTEGKLLASCFIFLLCILAIYLSYTTKTLLTYESEYKKIRDEGEIQKETLKRQNRVLMEEQDKSIYSAQLAERNRIAREIHDNVGHMLSRSILQVGAMMVVHKGEKVEDELKSLRQTLDTAMNNIRESVHDIRDDAIDLEAALEEIVSPLKGKYKVSFEFDADADEVSKDIKYAVINIVKEAVSNIIKYSRNEYVEIRFIEHPSMYQIVVHDYGNERTKGTIPENEGMGLKNIRIRAEKLGGNAYFTNEGGFRVFVRIPRN